MMWEAGDGSAARGQILWGGREFLRATPRGAVGFLEERDLAPAGLTVRLGDRADGAVVLDQDEPVTIELGLFGDVAFLVARLGQGGDLFPKISPGHARPVLLEEMLAAVLEDLIDRLGSPERLDVVEQSLRELLVGPREQLVPFGTDAVEAARAALAAANSVRGNDPVPFEDRQMLANAHGRDLQTP